MSGIVEKTPPTKPEKKVREAMTKERMTSLVNEELRHLKEQAQNLSKIVAELESAQRADAATTTVEAIAKALDDFTDVRPSLKRVRETLKQRILERLK